MSDVKWELVIDNHHHSVRRLAVPTGWIYQTQDGRKYSSAPGTIGRERDPGMPTWGPLVFVPAYGDKSTWGPLVFEEQS
jgi:hypothetical protein